MGIPVWKAGVSWILQELRVLLCHQASKSSYLGLHLSASYLWFVGTRITGRREPYVWRWRVCL